MRVKLNCPKVFKPLLAPARFKGAWGGRGSGKSHFFAGLVVVECLKHPGLRVLCIREIQKTLSDSSKRLIEDKLIEFGLSEGQGFSVLYDRILTPGGGVISFVGMRDQNADGIKSLEGYSIAWVEEAQTMSARSLALLTPTIRADDSELWFSWNPLRKSDPVDVLLRGEQLPTNAIVVNANWRDNPMFPAVLEQDRQDCQRIKPDQYPHIWEGEYARILVGAYYASHITAARAEGRISRVAADSLLPFKAFVDIGGTGAKSDAFAMWICQFVGREIRVLHYYEAVGQELGAHLAAMRAMGYTSAGITIYLPHDGRTHDRIYNVSYESAFTAAGFAVEVIPNQGAGAAMARIEAARRMFPSCWFNEATTAPGIDALGWYHERQDEIRQFGLGPDHDWSSHGADAFGLCAVAHESIITTGTWSADPDYSKMRRATC